MRSCHEHRYFPYMPWVILVSLLPHGTSLSARTAIPPPVFAARSTSSSKQFYASRLDTQELSISKCTTNVSITVPWFYSGEVPDGSYPSPLHSIYVESILLKEEAAKCLELARDFAAKSGSWEQPDSSRHQTYATCDFAVEECHALSSYLNDIGFDDRMWSRLSKLYNLERVDMEYLDFFCVNYRARNESHPRTMDRLESHRDGSLLSFTVLLSPPTDFEGGGTFFDALRDVSPEGGGPLCTNGVIRPPHAGGAVLHSGKLLHGADVVTSGERIVLVGFVDVTEWRIRPDVLSAACRDFGRMDVATFRYKRQKKKTENNSINGWVLNNSRWLQDSNRRTGAGRSYVRGFIPAFPSVARRAESEYQRRTKLEAEDILLRTLLLPERREDLFSDDELTIL